jgi:hypothetical protein
MKIGFAFSNYNDLRKPFSCNVVVGPTVVYVCHRIPFQRLPFQTVQYCTARLMNEE